MRKNNTVKMASVVGLLVGVVVAGPASAIPLQQLYDGATLTSGPIEFTNWSPNPGNNDPGASGVEVVATNPSPGRWGFSVDDTTGGLQGADALNFNFMVDAGSMAISEGLLELIQWTAEGGGTVKVDLSEQATNDLLLSVTDPAGALNLTDETSFDPVVPSPYDLRIDAGAVVSGPFGVAEVGTFGVEFSVVPEPGTAALLGLALLGLGGVALRRRAVA